MIRKSCSVSDFLKKFATSNCNISIQLKMEEKPTFEISDQFVSITGSHIWKIPEFLVWIKSQPNGEPCLGPQFKIKICLFPIKKFRLIIFRLSERDVRLFFKNCSDGDIIIDNLSMSANLQHNYNQWNHRQQTVFLKEGSLTGFIMDLSSFQLNSEDENSLIISVVLTIKQKIKNEIHSENTSLEKDLEHELKDLTFSDGTLSCQEKEFPCHRVLLSARYFFISILNYFSS